MPSIVIILCKTFIFQFFSILYILGPPAPISLMSDVHRLIHVSKPSILSNCSLVALENSVQNGLSWVNKMTRSLCGISTLRLFMNGSKASIPCYMNGSKASMSCYIKKRNLPEKRSVLEMKGNVANRKGKRREFC